MNKEFFEALNDIEKERGIKKEVLIEKITKAMEAAVKKELGIEGNIIVTIDEETSEFNVAVITFQQRSKFFLGHAAFGIVEVAYE